MSDPTADARRAEIAAGLAAVEERIARACAAAGRERADITLVAVTKTFPASDVGHLAALGLRDMGENRAADAEAKAARCRADGLDDLVWHFVGQVQTNKAAVVAGCADVVHSVDRARLVHALDRAAGVAGRRVRCLLQVDLTTDEVADADADAGERGTGDRGGARPDDLAALAAELLAAEHLDLGGLMAVAPLGADPDEAFARLAEVAADLRRAHPGATVVSAGMSGDLEAAVRHGATHLRVGTALLGSRPSLR